jgi:hypothetical protein
MGAWLVLAAPPATAEPRPSVSVRPAADGCPVSAFLVELQALGLDATLADRDAEHAAGPAVALQREAEGTSLVLWAEPGGGPRRIPVGAASCDDAVVMAALIVNRRLRDGHVDGPPVELSLRAPGGSARDPAAVERAPEARTPPPVLAVPVAIPWTARLDVLSGVELAFPAESPHGAGVEARAVVSPGVRALILSAGLGFSGQFGWPSSEGSVAGWTVEAMARGGLRLRAARIELEPTLGLGLAHHLVRLGVDGAPLREHTLPRLEGALGLGFSRPLSVRVDLGLLWAPWALRVVSASRELDAVIGGLSARVRIGFGIDFL